MSSICKENKKIAINAVLNTIKTVFGIIFPIITYPYVFRILGVDNIGIYTFSSSFISYFILLASLGISTYGIREGAKIRDDKVAFELFSSEIFSINLIASLVSYILLFVLLAIPFLGPYQKVVLLLSIEIVFSTFGVSWIYNVYEDFLAIAVITTIFQLIALIFIFLFVRTPNDLYKYILCLLVSNSGPNLINFFYIRKKYSKYRFTFRIDWKKHIKPILVVFSTSIAITVYVSSDSTMLGFMTNDYQVGLYGTAVKIYTVFKNILSAVLLVLVPGFTLLFTKKDFNTINKRLSNIFNALSLIIIPMSLGVFLLSKDIVLIISGEEYIGSVVPLRILSIAIVFSLYAYFFTQCVLIPNSEENKVFRATLISSIINIVLNFILIPFGGIIAAAITTVIAEIITFLISLYYTRNTIKLSGVLKNFISIILGCFFIIAVYLIFKGIDILILRVSFTIICSIVVYFVFLFLVKNPALYQIKSLFRHNE